MTIFEGQTWRVRTRTPEQRAGVSVRWSDWRFAGAVATFCVLGSAALSFVVPALLGSPQWSMSGDVWWTVQSAQWVSHGAIGTVYEANPWYSALPGFLILLAPIVALGDHLGLVTSYPFQLAHPSMWEIVAPFFFACGAACVLGIDYLCDTLQLPRRRRRTVLVSVALVVVIPTPGFAGHPEDLLALALVCVCLACAIRQRWQGAMLVLAVAILMQTWACLLVPILVAASPAGSRIRNLIRATALPGACAAMLLALDFPAASSDLLKQPMVNRGQRLPWWYLAGHMKVVVGRTPIQVVVGSSSRWLAVAFCLLLAVAIYRDPRPLSLVRAAGVAMFLRAAFETEIWSYYLAPAAVLLAVAVAGMTIGRTKRYRIGMVFSLLLTAAWPAAYFGIRIPSGLAEFILTASAAVTLSTTRSDPVRNRQRAHVPPGDALAPAASSIAPGLAYSKRGA